MQRPPQGQYQQQYTSSNTPRQYNNATIPMDIDCTRAPNWWGRGGNPSRGRAAQTSNTPRNNAPLTCFNCNQPGHFTRNCPQRCQQRPQGGYRAQQTNLIDWNEDDAYLDKGGYEEPEQDQISQLKAQIRRLSLEDTNRLADKMGDSEDFPSA